MLEKICKIHGDLSSENIIKEPNKTAKRGFTLRCRLCKQEKDRRWISLNPDKNKAKSRKRKEDRRLYREGLTDVIPKANLWSREDRKKNPEKHKEWARITRENQGQERNVYEISRRRGITKDQYKEMLKAQDYKCAICIRPETRLRTDGSISELALDHCHKTNRVRKFLCHNCNTMLGLFKDDIEIIQSAIQYLQHQGELCQK